MASTLHPFFWPANPSFHRLEARMPAPAGPINPFPNAGTFSSNPWNAPPGFSNPWNNLFQSLEPFGPAFPNSGTLDLEQYKQLLRQGNPHSRGGADVISKGL
jgi:hypothetical protein